MTVRGRSVPRLRNLEKMRTYNDGTRSLTESIMVPEVTDALCDWLGHGGGGVLIGGLALSFYVKPRATQDIDLLFLSETDVPDHIPGFTKPRPNAFQHDITQVAVEIVAPDYAGLPLELFSKVAETAVENEGMKVASPSALVAMKIFNTRLQDLADIVALIHTGQVELAGFSIPDDRMVLYQYLVERAAKEASSP